MRYEAGITVGRLRDKQSVGTFLQKENEEIQRQKAAADKMAEELAETLRENRALEREALRQHLRDNNLKDQGYLAPFVSDELKNVRTSSLEETAQINTEAAYAALPIMEAEGYVPNRDSSEFIIQYLNSNGLYIFGPSPDLLIAAWRRLGPGTPEAAGANYLEFRQSEPAFSTTQNISQATQKMTADDFAKAIGLKRARPEAPVPMRNGYIPSPEGWNPKLSADENRANLYKRGQTVRLRPRDPYRN